MPGLDEKILAEWDNIRESATILFGQKLDFSSMKPLELAGVAAYLHSLYNGIENILKQILTEDDIIGVSSTWHRDLLLMSEKRGIISEQLRIQLRNWLAFRHFFQHGYSQDIDPMRLCHVHTIVPGVLEQFRSEIEKTLSARIPGFEGLKQISREV